MPKSRFDVILKHRTWIEEKIQRELAEVKESLEQAEGRLAFKNQLQEDSWNHFHTKQNEGVSASENLSYSLFFDRLSIEIKEQERMIRHIENEFNNKLAELVKASREKEMIKKLKEGELKELYDEELREEQRFIDEIGISKYNRDRARKNEEGVRI